MTDTSFRAAVIDVGTNSIKIVIGQIDQSGTIEIIHEASTIVRIGEGLESSKIISPYAAQRGIEAIARQLKTAADFGVQALKVIGTSAIREAANAGEFLSLVRNLLGVEICVISGEAEAEYAYKAVVNDPSFGLVAGSITVADIGGGSTEITHGVGDRIDSINSIGIGAVRISELFLKDDPPSLTSLDKAYSYILHNLKIINIPRTNLLVCIGGTAINIGRIIRSVSPEQTSKINGVKITRKELNYAILMISQIPLINRKNLVGLDPDRADIIIGGGLIIECLLRHLQMNCFQISTRGLRHAILFEMMRSSFQNRIR